MQEWDDIALLREYTGRGSEPAFAALAARHVNKVYAAALRQTGNPHQAEEITQAVFVILARQAGSLRRGHSLSGWFYQTARLTATTFRRSEIRRARREQEACMQNLLNQPAADDATATPASEETWRQIAPLLDDALAKLSATDRHAVVLRFFDGRSMAEIGAALGGSEAAAKMRVSRALKKLRQFFLRRGVTLTLPLLAAAVAAHAAPAAPAGLAQTLSAVAITKGTAASTTTLTLIKGTLKLMAWTKAKTVIVVSAAALLATGTTTVVVKEVQAHRKYPWQTTNQFTDSFMAALPPQVKILPSDSTANYSARFGNGKGIGRGLSLDRIISDAYYEWAATRIIFNTKIPTNRYDYIVNLPNENAEALQREIKRKFGLVGKLETRDKDVMLLNAKTLNAPGLKPTKSLKGYESSRWPNQDEFQGENISLSGLANQLEELSRIPIINNTGLTNRYDIDLKASFHLDNFGNPIWPVSLEDIKPALAGQLGLELIPTNMPIEMLVVDKAK